MRRRKLVQAAVTAVLLGAVALPAADGHWYYGTAPTGTNAGSRVYRYYSRDPTDSNLPFNCRSSTQGGIDPANVLVWHYGDATVVNGHIENETHWGYFSGISHVVQYLCIVDSAGTLIAYESTYDEQDGHGSTLGATRAHFRIWGDSHAHSATIDRWSVLTVHHERRTLTNGHVIDEDWEVWEDHFDNEIDPHHGLVRDRYRGASGGLWRGYYDNGLISQVGGQHV